PHRSRRCISAVSAPRDGIVAEPGDALAGSAREVLDLARKLKRQARRPSASTHPSGGVRSITRLNDTVSATTFSTTAIPAATATQASGRTSYSPIPAANPSRFAPLSPSIAVSRRSNGSTTTAPTRRPTTAGASEGTPQIANASPGRRNALSERPGTTSSPFHRFAHAARSTIPSTSTEVCLGGCRGLTTTAEPAITRILTSPVVGWPEAAERRWSRRPRGPAGTRSSITPAPNTSRRPPSAPQPAVPTSANVATTTVHTTASIASAIPRTRGTSAPRWFWTGGRPPRTAAPPRGSSDDPGPEDARQARPRDVPALPAAVEEPARGPEGGAVLEPLDRDLDHANTRADRVDRHRGLDPEPARERPHDLHRLGAERALPGQGLARSEPGLPPDQVGGEPLDAPDPPRPRGGQDRDREIGLPPVDRLEQRGEVRGGRAEVAVHQQPQVGRPQPPQRALEGPALARGTTRPQHRRAGVGRLGGGRIARPVVDHHAPPGR